MLSGKKVPRLSLAPICLQAAQLGHVLMTFQYFASPCLTLNKPPSAHLYDSSACHTGNISLMPCPLCSCIYFLSFAFRGHCHECPEQAMSMSVCRCCWWSPVTWCGRSTCCR